MPSKKEESHDCKAECAELHKQLAALKKEIAALKKELKVKSSAGVDPRVDKLWEELQNKPHFWLSKKLFDGA